MATKTLNIGVDAYNLLAANKGPGESFTDVILRIAKPRSTLLDLAGTLTQAEADAMKRDMAESRARSAKRRQVMDRRFAQAVASRRAASA